MSTIYINTDGGSRGNPGPAGIGVAFYDEKGNEIHAYGEYIGEATNNQAEYLAIIKGLEILKKSKWYKEKNARQNGEVSPKGRRAKIVCRLDSQLVVEQINGNYKVKNDEIRKLKEQIDNLVSDMQIEKEFIHVPREENKLADKMVNNAIDKELKKQK